MSRSAPKILVVDDSEICRMIARHFLEEQGYAVVELASPLGLTSALTTHNPDLVLMDVVMPSLDGDKAVEIALRHQVHCCPFVLYSDRSESELSALALSSGASGYVCKEEGSHSLLSTIEHLLQPAPTSG